MFMTEKQGGTDVGLTETVATDRGTHWTLTGQKWFASNPSADVITHPRPRPGPGRRHPRPRHVPGAATAPRRQPQRDPHRPPQDKLGSKSIASGEVTLDEAYATPVGRLTDGFRQMAEMLNVSGSPTPCAPPP
ncbi:acyl-CoA dehydrogenase family protein [Streptomyces sp. KL116D]|uniref:acyl-CoA dehydrogenase family protein n=1 Tax=Streptomyces sp. KL116D TaxID=3045152 RepID=UPI0035574041